MVKRKIPKAELRRHIRETPFTRDEVQRLWHRFNCMDLDGSGLLNYQVCLVALFGWHLQQDCTSSTGRDRASCFRLAPKPAGNIKGG